MEIEPTAISGVYLVRLNSFVDARGSFTKTFQAVDFATAELRTDFREQYFSMSHPGVIRGLHFQLPPADHAKLVVAVAGSVFDVAVDVRPGSPTYGSHVSAELSPGKLSLYMPVGIAHGFAVLGQSPATLLYNVTSVHSPEHDAGIRWDSANIDWPIDNPLVSNRDAALPSLDSFIAPEEWRLEP